MKEIDSPIFKARAMLVTEGRKRITHDVERVVKELIHYIALTYLRYIMVQTLY